MSIRAGSIIHTSGYGIVIDRLQSAGLGDARIPVETIREVGNDLVVDKVPGEAEFTFGLESWDVSTEMIAIFNGKVDGGAADAAGTEYRWENCKYINILSPWKRNTGTEGGNISGGVIVPNYYPTRLRYRYGVTDNAVQEAELAGGSFYYAHTSPMHDTATGNGTTTDFTTTENARALRIGGPHGTTFRRVLGVTVDGVLQIEGTDFTQSISGADTGAPAATTVAFTVAPANAAEIQIVYFTETAKAFPQSVNPDATVKPGAVRGRDIEVLLGADGIKIPGTQSFELEATVDGEVEREMGNSDAIGRAVTGTDVTGTLNFRPKDIAAFFTALNLATGVDVDEVFGYYSNEPTPVEILIHDPSDRGTILKTLYVSDGLFQPPGTPARVNTATEWSMRFDSKSGSYSEYKGARPTG